MEELLKIFEGEEENLTQKEKNIFIWSKFLGEEEDLTEEEKKYWEVRR